MSAVSPFTNPENLVAWLRERFPAEALKDKSLATLVERVALRAFDGMMSLGKRIHQSSDHGQLFDYISLCNRVLKLFPSGEEKSVDRLALVKLIFTDKKGPLLEYFRDSDAGWINETLVSLKCVSSPEERYLILDRAQKLASTRRLEVRVLIKFFCESPYLSPDIQIALINECNGPAATLVILHALEQLPQKRREEAARLALTHKGGRQSVVTHLQNMAEFFRRGRDFAAFFATSCPHKRPKMDT